MQKYVERPKNMAYEQHRQRDAKGQSITQKNNIANRMSAKVTNRLASSSLRFASISLLGGYFGRLDGSHA